MGDINFTTGARLSIYAVSGILITSLHPTVREIAIKDTNIIIPVIFRMVQIT